MTRIRIFTASALLLCALPFWRWLDLIAFTWPLNSLFAIGALLVLSLFVALPVKLLRPKMNYAWAILIPAVGLFAYLEGPLSKMSTTDPSHSHCGTLTYTGLLHPLRTVATGALQDDLEARNQLCWVRKMILRVPLNLKSVHELSTYKDLLQKRLLLPDQKFKSTLPMVAALDIYLIYRYEGQILSLQNYQNGKGFLESLQFWEQQYTVEISSRAYGWWDWPFSALIKFEYGLIERHWKGIIDNITVEFST